MKKSIQKAGALLADWLYPMATYCVCCGNLIDRSRSYCLCDHCIRRIQWGWLTIDLTAQEAETGRRNYLDSAAACISYGLYGRRLIFDLKYNRHTYVARVIADILADRILSDPDAQHLREADYLVPVPLHAKRLAQRGFNQTAKIGKYLEKRLRDAAEPQYPHLLDGALLRTKETAPQRALSGEERSVNLAGAFAIRPASLQRIAGARILLLDDVYTTGATANQCAKALKESGAAEVHFAALATGSHYASGHFRSDPDLRAEI